VNENPSPSDLYQENILDHYKYPRNFEPLESPDIHEEGVNPLCGDRVELFLKLDGEKRVAAMTFQGVGCAICLASTSMLTEYVEGKGLDEIKALQKEDILKLLGIPIGPVRLKCAILSLMTLKQGVAFYEGEKTDSTPATTEE